MLYYIKLSVLLISSVTLFSGCAHQYNPTPNDTILDNSHEYRPNWIDPYDSYSEQGLSLRAQDSFMEYSMNEYSNKPALTSVYFSYDHIDIKPSERNKLIVAIDFLNQNPNASLLIIGKCDWHGTEEYNTALGDRRANAVKSYLMELGANPQNIRTLSKGSLEATMGLSVEDAWQDRRVDVIVLE